MGCPKMDLNDPKWTAVVVTKGGGSGYPVFAAGNIIGIGGGKYCWYQRREILLVFAAGNITGISVRKYYWYLRVEILLVLAGGDTIASCSIRRMGITSVKRITVQPSRLTVSLTVSSNLHVMSESS